MGREREEYKSSTQSKPAEDVTLAEEWAPDSLAGEWWANYKKRRNGKPSWIRRNFFQICVVLLLAWIGWNLELVVDSYDYSSQNFMEDIMASELETDFYVP